MPGVGRYVKMHAKPGQGDALAQQMLEVANALRDTPGCELYAINRSPIDSDVVWVTEQWRSQEQVDAALEQAREGIAAVRELVREGGFERIDVEPIGGVGHTATDKGFALVNLEEVEDQAPKFGFGELGEARFARGDLGSETVAISLQRLQPGARQAFGHTHHRDEEIYVILRGSGRVAVDDQVHDVRALDAIRIAPGSVRAFEAGEDGLEILATGAHTAGDAQMVPGYWPE
ncbi:MAG TPA: antibiotic biosynthesis monooxygenase [Solirubrobacteraceae bacterium]|jgi:quinol monooxygenase YgiN/quercetin dioxygenase-like cupin family protein|nr:antibiotic biosynthesis monooxygenase [Solirubrobacteraceae bacterium]